MKSKRFWFFLCECEFSFGNTIAQFNILENSNGNASFIDKGNDKSIEYYNIFQN